MLAKVRGSLYYAVLFVSVVFAAATGIVGASVTILRNYGCKINEQVWL